MRLCRADQLILTNMMARQLTQGSAHFREQAEAWLADVLGEEASDNPKRGGVALTLVSATLRGWGVLASREKVTPRLLYVQSPSVEK